VRNRFSAVLILAMCTVVLWALSSHGLAKEKTKAPPATAKTTVKTPPLPSTDNPPPATAVRGGTVRMISPYFVKNLGYPPEMAPSDSIFNLPLVERLVYWDEKGNLIP
jgi:hypothetical protein